MTAQTGRTVSKWVIFEIEDSGGALRSIPVNSISGCGLTWDWVDLTAWKDAVKGGMNNQAGVEITISGPFDTTATTGSHTVLSGIDGGATPLAMNIKFGMQHTWESGEPVFGIASSATSGMVCTSYTVNPDDMTYSATFGVYAGSSSPDWATDAYTVT